MIYKYSLDSRKFICPQCGEKEFNRYIENETQQFNIDKKYGKCWRLDKCNYHLYPENNCIQDTSDNINTGIKDLYNSDILDSKMYLEIFHLRQNQDFKEYSKTNLSGNVFLSELSKRFGVEPVLNAVNKYKLGYFFNGGIMFPYFFNNDLKSAKIMSFKPDLHRNKDISPMWLHSYSTFNYYDKKKRKQKVNNLLYPIENVEYDNFRKYRSTYTKESICTKYNFCIPLFGWDLLSLPENKDKTICLVESEKTAVICSIVFPDFVWLGCGGMTYLQQYKFNRFNNRKWLIFPDLSTNDKTKNYWIKRINIIKTKYDMDDYFIDFMPKENTDNEFNLTAKTKGLDIADYILDYHLPCGKYSNYIEYMKAVLNNTYEDMPIIGGHKFTDYDDYCIRNAKEGILVEDIPDSGFTVSDELKQELIKIINKYNKDMVVKPAIVEPAIVQPINTTVIDLMPKITANSIQELEKLLIDADKLDRIESEIKYNNYFNNLYK